MKSFYLITCISILTLTQINCNNKKTKQKSNNKALTIVSHGGSYSKTQKKYSINPYIKESSNNVIMEDYSGGTEELKTQVKSGNINWDVVSLEWTDLESACAEGLLEELAHDKIILSGSDGTPAREDFISEALSSKCGIGTIIWSVVIAYKEGNFSQENQPKTIKDFFNTNKFPGKRAIKKRPQVILEWALLADGVEKNQIYDILETQSGVNRAFRKIDSIKKDIIWYESWGQGPQLLISQDAKIIQTANGRIYYSIMHDNQQFKIIWDNHSYDLDAWAIPKGSPNKKLAIDFIRFATQTKALAGMPIEMAYGATRKSASKFYDSQYTKYLPTTYLDKGFKLSSEFWKKNLNKLTQRFNAWLIKN